MDTDIYDEFGNYIGPTIDSDNESLDEIDGDLDDNENLEDEDDIEEHENEIDDVTENNQEVVLHEEKKYYPTSAELYGPDVETLVEEEDENPLTDPTVKPIVKKVFTVSERSIPRISYSLEFLHDLMDCPDRIRNIAIFGNLHCGKTTFMDCLVEQTHLDIMAEEDQNIRYTDHLKLEIERGLSIKSTPMTFLLPDIRDKSYLFNILDTPGHVNFSDEVTASFRLCDGVCLLIDASEGVTANVERMIKQAIQDQLQITLVINKLDRLILELKLPPQDAYSKLRDIIDSVNVIINTYSESTPAFLSDYFDSITDAINSSNNRLIRIHLQPEEVVTGSR